MIITLCLTLLIVTLASLYFTVKKNQRTERFELQKCLTQLKSLKELLIHIQRHRGLTTGYLHGEQTLRADIQAVQSRTNDLWKSLAANHPGLTKDKLFEGISSHWQRLEARSLTIEPNNNIDQHNRLITNLLYLIENQTDQNRLFVTLSREAGLDVIWKELLGTIEAIGQTRAIGMGVVSEGKSTALDRIKLKYLSERVSAQFESLSNAFLESSPGKVKTIAREHEYSVSAIKKAKSKIIELQSFIDNTLLDARIDSSSAIAFFQVASDAITPLNELFDLATNELATSIDL